MTRLFHRHAGVIVAAAFTLLLAGCSPAAREKTLSFFFDGVPGAEDPGALPADRAGLGPVFHPETATALSAPAALPTVSVHAPVFQRQCNCYSSRR